MGEIKTKKTDASVDVFLEGVADETRLADCRALVALMSEVTGAPPKMWGPSIVGFGDYHYKGASGRGTDWFRVGFSPRKKDLTLYIMSGFQRYPALMAQLGKHSTGKSCLYIKRLSDVNQHVLRELIEESLHLTGPSS